MEFRELTAEEKLVCVICGEPAWTEGVKHFLSDEGRKAVNDLLDEFVAKKRATGPGVNSEKGVKRGVKVLRLRFGFEPRSDAEKLKYHGSDSRTLDETKVYFGVTRERIRQIENKMLRMLRHPVYSSKLRPYISGATKVG